MLRKLRSVRRIVDMSNTLHGRPQARCLRLHALKLFHRMHTLGQISGLRSSSVELIKWTSPHDLAVSWNVAESSMIIRSSFSCARHLRQRAVIGHKRYGVAHLRRTSTGPLIGATPSPPSSAASPLAIITNELDKLSTRYEIPSDAVEILSSPADFYETLKVMEFFTSTRT